MERSRMIFFVLDDIEGVQRVLAKKLIEEFEEVCDVVIIESTRQGILTLFEAGALTEYPDCIISDIYTGSDDIPLFYQGVRPVLKQDISDDNLIGDITLIEVIGKTWPEAKLFVFSQFRNSTHLTIKQKRSIEGYFKELGIPENQIISKDPLDEGLGTIISRVASTFELPTSKRHRDKAVLVVEDMESDREEIAARLAEEGITVYLAAGRKEALSILSEFIEKNEKLPDCIITDLYMPPEREKAGTKMISDIKEGDKVFHSIITRLDSFATLREAISKVPIIVFSLYAVSEKLDGPQVKAIELRLDELDVPQENRIIKTGQFRERLEQVVERLLSILESENKEESANHDKATE